MMMSLLLTMGLTMLSMQEPPLRDGVNMARDVQTKMLAQSALAEGRWYASQNPNWIGTSPEQTLQVDGKDVGTYEYAVAKSGTNIYDITGTAYIPNKSAGKKVTFAQTYRYRIPNPEVLFDDGFESGNFNLWQTWTAEAGSHVAWDVTNTTPKKGARHARVRKTCNDNVRETASLFTNTFDLSQYDQVVLRFSYRKDNGGNGDSFQVWQSSDGGGSWAQIFNDSSSATSSGYVRPSVQLSVNNRTAQTKFRFDGVIDTRTANWYLDGVQLASPFVVYDVALDQ